MNNKNAAIETLWKAIEEKVNAGYNSDTNSGNRMIYDNGCVSLFKGHGILSSDDVTAYKFFISPNGEVHNFKPNSDAFESENETLWRELSNKYSKNVATPEQKNELMQTFIKTLKGQGYLSIAKNVEDCIADSMKNVPQNKLLETELQLKLLETQKSKN